MFEVEKNLKTANISRAIRFTEEMFEELQRIAQKNDISFNLLVLQCCKYALDNMVEKEKKEHNL